jgi:hypothetical protein
MPQVAALKITNIIIYALSLIGSLILIGVGAFAGQCIERSSYDGECYEYIASPSTIGNGFAVILISTLLFQVISVFALHVEKSHSAQ